MHTMNEIDNQILKAQADRIERFLEDWPLTEANLPLFETHVLDYGRVKRILVSGRIVLEDVACPKCFLGIK